MPLPTPSHEISYQLSGVVPGTCACFVISAVPGAENQYLVQKFAGGSAQVIATWNGSVFTA